MSGFAERAEQYKSGQLRGIVNEAAAPTIVTQEERAIDILRATDYFRENGLHGFLMDAVRYARSVDGRFDARVDFDFHEAGRSIDWSKVQKPRIEADDTAADAFRKIREAAGLSDAMDMVIGTVAWAEMKWNIDPGQTGAGYSFVLVNYYPYRHRAVVLGEQEECALYLPDSRIEEAITRAYFNPGIRLPQSGHPENPTKK